MGSLWYLRRFRAMRPREIGRRVFQKARQIAWWWRYYALGMAPSTGLLSGEQRFISGVGRAFAGEAPDPARTALLKAADGLLEGHWSSFSLPRNDVMPDVDWHCDPKSGAKIPSDAYTFGIRIHGEAISFDTKYVWDLSRHHQTTVLAMAYWLTGDVRYAEAAAALVIAWVSANPFLHGVHWSSGVEMGTRLISFIWTRRLLEDWPGVTRIFEKNSAFQDSLHAHQWLLARSLSRGSSANNHLIWELLGLYLASSSMPWFEASASWRELARHTLLREFQRQTFPSGINRELASSYNTYVCEALLLFLVEGSMTGDEGLDDSWELASRIIHRLASFADCNGEPPHQGDSDSAWGLLVDAPGFSAVCDLLWLGACWFGLPDWWPDLNQRPLRSWLWSRLVSPPQRLASANRDNARSALARDAGLAILRANVGRPDEIYCAFDAGPLGYLSIAAHGHADALAIELRVGGIPILVDPGTYSYTTVRWRDYFRSTLAHNTVEIGGRSQSQAGGPFLWTRACDAQLLAAEGLDDDLSVAMAEGEHRGANPRAGICHRRRVTLHRQERRLVIEDNVVPGHEQKIRLLFHLHPNVACRIERGQAFLSWRGTSGICAALLELPDSLKWEAVRGSENPILGWYSPAYDCKEASTSLIGTATFERSVHLITILRLHTP